MKRSFQNPADFEVSNLISEIKSEFTCQRRKEFEYNTVHTYTCKMSRRVGYEKGPKEIRIIFPSDSLSLSSYKNKKIMTYHGFLTLR